MPFISSQLSTIVVIAAAVVASNASYAVEVKVGIVIAVEGEGFFLNPVVRKIWVKEVVKSSLAEAAGMVAGDEIIQIEGQPVVGKRALDLKPYMKFGAGETRTLRLRHENGNPFDAKITKPND